MVFLLARVFQMMAQREEHPEQFAGIGAVGMVGLGMMGEPMAGHLLDRLPGTRTLNIHGRTPSKLAPLIERGAHWVETPAGLGESSDVIVVMLPDLPELDEVMAGDDGLFERVSRSLTVVIMSTSSAAGVRDLADRLSTNSAGLVRVVDAPVSGGVEGATEGTLSIMVGGADGDVARVMPILGLMGTPVHLGPLGSGQIAKACNQLIVASTMLALGEAAVIAERSGLDLDRMLTLLEGGYAASRMLQTRRQRLIDKNYDPLAPARFLLKDLGFAAAAAEQTGTIAPQLQVVQQVFAQLIAAGLGNEDMSVTQRFIAELSVAAEHDR